MLKPPQFLETLFSKQLSSANITWKTLDNPPCLKRAYRYIHLQIVHVPFLSYFLGVYAQIVFQNPGRLLYVRGYTTHLYRDFNQPLQGSPLTN